MSADDRPFAMHPGFVTSTSPLQVQPAGSASAAYAVQLGGGTLGVGDKVYCLQIQMAGRSQLAVLAVN